MKPVSLALVIVASLSIVATTAHAEEMAPLAPSAGPVADEPAPSQKLDTSAKPSPQPYVAPFLLRGVTPGNSVRLDTTVAPFTDPKTHLGQTETVSLFSVSGRIDDHFALSGRFGVVRNDHPNPTKSIVANGVTNATVGGMWGTTVADFWRFSASAGVGLPIGSGGGNDPDPDRVAAMKAASLARAGLDNTMFAMNDVGFPVGFDAAYVRKGFTGQIEASLVTSARVKGEQQSPDKSKVNATGGVFAGYFVVPRRLSLGAELHYQRFLSTPDAVAKDPSQRDNLTAGGGVRGHFEVASNVVFRPGIAYGTGITGVIADRGYQMVQVDLPINF